MVDSGVLDFCVPTFYRPPCPWQSVADSTRQAIPSTTRNHHEPRISAVETQSGQRSPLTAPAGKWRMGFSHIAERVNPNASHQSSSRCRRPFWTVRRPLRPRNPDPRPGRTGRGVRQGRRRSRSSTRSWPICIGTTWAGRRRCTSPSGSPTHCGGARIYLKREDLNHTGAHKINNTLGQALLDAPDGQAAGDRRDRRRPARRGHRHGLRPLRAGVRGLHGRGRHPPAAAQRLQHEAAGGRGPRRSPAARGPCATPSTRPSATG